VVRQDPQEQGLRAILNYGHTVGHAIEAVLGYGVIPHGAAVSLGMSAAAEISVRLGMLDSHSAGRQDALLRQLELPTLCFPRQPADFHVEPVGPATGSAVPASVCPEASHASPLWGISSLPPTSDLLSAMALDKKSIGGRLRFVLARSLGAVEVREVPTSLVAWVLEEARVC
jgi:3-dehydroquinate synthase